MTLRRRTLLAALPLIGLAGVPARAQQSPEAAAPIGQFNDALLAILHAGKGAPFPQRYATLAPVVERVFDLETILSGAVGLRWSKLAPDEQASALGVFTRFTVASYVAAFDNFNGQRFEIVPAERSVGEGVVVQTQIVRADRTTARIDYVMHEGTGGWRAVDVLLDGSISRVAVLRSDFRKLLTQDSALSLIASLKQKVTDLSGGTMTG